jgi:hypothetical protein
MERIIDADRVFMVEIKDKEIFPHVKYYEERIKKVLWWRNIRPAGFYSSEYSQYGFTVEKLHEEYPGCLLIDENNTVWSRAKVKVYLDCGHKGSTEIVYRFDTYEQALSVGTQAATGIKAKIVFN